MLVLLVYLGVELDSVSDLCLKVIDHSMKLLLMNIFGLIMFELVVQVGDLNPLGSDPSFEPGGLLPIPIIFSSFFFNVLYQFSTSVNFTLYLSELHIN